VLPVFCVAFLRKETRHRKFNSLLGPIRMVIPVMNFLKKIGLPAGVIGALLAGYLARTHVFPLMRADDGSSERLAREMSEKADRQISDFMDSSRAEYAREVFAAIRQNDTVRLEQAIRSDWFPEEVRFSIRNRRGESPLTFALRQKAKIAIIEMLLAKGADPDVSDRSGTTPRELAVELGREERAGFTEPRK
jgi:hypothetical protein